MRLKANRGTGGDTRDTWSVTGSHLDTDMTFRALTDAAAAVWLGFTAESSSAAYDHERS
jgi:hypothetical protein